MNDVYYGGVKDIEINSNRSYIATIATLPPGKNNAQTRLNVFKLEDFQDIFMKNNINGQGLAFFNDGSKLVLPYQKNTALGAVDRLFSIAGLGSPPKEIGFEIVNINNGKSLQRTKLHSSDVSEIAVSPHNKFIATGDKDEIVPLWSVKKDKVVHTFRHNDKTDPTIWDLTFSDDHSYLLSSGSDGGIKLWNYQKKIAKKKFSMEQERIHLELSWIPDSNKLVSATDAGELVLWSLNQKQPLQTIEVASELGTGHMYNDNPTGLSVSPDGTKVAIGLKNGVIKIFQIP